MENENMNTNLGPDTNTNVNPVPDVPVVPSMPVAQPAPEAPVAPGAPVPPVSPEENKEGSGINSKAILAAFLMLVVTAISLTTATYAWFTENTTVTVDSIDVNVGASNGIQISVDAVNWVANISTDDITDNAYTGNVNQLPSNIVPVSTAGNVDAATGRMQMFKGALEADATTAHGYRLISTASNEVAGTNGDFIAFDIFILATQATTVYLTTSSDVIATGANSGLKNAARVAFLNQGSAAVGASTDAIALHGAQSRSVAGQTTNIFWEPNANEHTAGGVAQAVQYGLTTFTATQVVPNYFGISAAFGATPAVDYQSTTTGFTSVTPNIQTNSPNNGAFRTLFNLAAGINKIRIYGWVEGQDYDCENNASGSNITFNIQISRNAS